uniref:Ac2 n=1 Tax=Panagrellus redivivus TaxID=6233 RepID=A0A7E4W598_PANRE
MESFEDRCRRLEAELVNKKNEVDTLTTKLHRREEDYRKIIVENDKLQSEVVRLQKENENFKSLLFKQESDDQKENISTNVRRVAGETAKAQNEKLSATPPRSSNTDLDDELDKLLEKVQTSLTTKQLPAAAPSFRECEAFAGESARVALHMTMLSQQQMHLEGILSLYTSIHGKPLNGEWKPYFVRVIVRKLGGNVDNVESAANSITTKKAIQAFQDPIRGVVVARSDFDLTECKVLKFVCEELDVKFFVNNHE